MTAPVRGMTAIWIDQSQATVAHWEGSATIRRVSSEVPCHHQSTGHLRHDPLIRHAGGGLGDDRFARDHDHHLEEFLERVVALVPCDGEVEILGPGTTREHLARLLSATDHHRGRIRGVTTTPSPPISDRQLVARLRERAGDPPRRRTFEREP